jgi:hypothetical protein
MLNLHRPEQIAEHIGIDLAILQGASEDLRTGKNPDAYCQEMICYDSAGQDKERRVLVIRSQFRLIQRRIYSKLLLPRYTPSDHSHGGVGGRSIKSNVAQHQNSKYGLTVDISNFYPSISHQRVYTVFTKNYGCHPDAARMLTRLTTYKGHLALGLVTSPILADSVMRDIDSRLAKLCESRNAIYSRFVDDIAITADYPLDPDKNNLHAQIASILKSVGLDLNDGKTNHGRLDQGLAITGLRISRSGSINVQESYIKELERRLDDAHSLSKDGKFAGPYFTDQQILGQIYFIRWINKSTALPLFKKFRSISWGSVRRIANERSYIKREKLLKPAIRSDWT